MKIRDKFKFGASSEARKKTVSTYLQITADRMLVCSPVDVSIPWMGGKRTAEEQKAIFNEGNSRCDGFKTFSYHQKTDDKDKGLALDLAPYISGVGISYEAPARSGIIGTLMLEAWEELQDEGRIPNTLYLHWGGLWSHKDNQKIGWDMWHFEIRDYEQKELI